MASPGDERGAWLLAEEELVAGSDNFLNSLCIMREPKALASLADKWKNDPRPWAREMMRQYVAMPFDHVGHQVVVKRLFKQAEARGDDEMMALFAVAFDRLVRRRRSTKGVYDRATRSYTSYEVLVSPRNVIREARKGRNPQTGELMSFGQKRNKQHRLFHYRTRYYLQRRAWRYLRVLAFRDAGRFLKTISIMLAAWKDVDLQAGENLIDSWSLMHALHAESSAVQFSSLRASLTDGCTLADLKPAPAFSKHWRSAAGEATALKLALEAKSRLVWIWAIAWHRELARSFKPRPTAEIIRQLLACAHEDKQAYGAELLQSCDEAAGWPLETWLDLLKVESPTVAQLICDAMMKHVTEDRLSVAQCVEVTCAKPTPIARMGLTLLQERSITDVATLLPLAGAACLGVGYDIAQWALSQLGSEQHYQMPQVCRFFDSGNSAIRAGAWAWLSDESSRGFKDSALWSRLTETPYEDMRLRLVDALTLRAAAPKLSPADLAPLWSTVLLNVHRGGRSKLRAVRQIADALVQHPAEQGSLLPVLVTAVRSIRGPEARGALAAVLSVVTQRPEMESAVEAALPELKLQVSPDGRAAA
jgi:hypothetical protein